MVSVMMASALEAVNLVKPMILPLMKQWNCDGVCVFLSYGTKTTKPKSSNRETNKVYIGLAGSDYEPLAAANAELTFRTGLSSWTCIDRYPEMLKTGENQCTPGANCGDYNDDDMRLVVSIAGGGFDPHMAHAIATAIIAAFVSAAARQLQIKK